VQGFGANETFHFRTTTFWAQLLLASVVVHEYWPVSQSMIVEMGAYAWSEHIVTVILACQITIKNVQVQLTVKGKTTPDSCTPPRVGPHFDNHALADRPIFMDDNARPHRAQIVQHFLQQEAVQTIPWSAKTPKPFLGELLPLL
jgi:hypothetical protein